MSAVAKRYFDVGSYADFKTLVGLYGTNRNVYWANSPGNYTWIMNFDPVGDIAIFGSGFVLTNATITSDFPSAVQISTSSSTSRLLCNQSTSSPSAGCIMFHSSGVYSEFKTLVSDLNFGGSVFYFTQVGTFICAAYSADAVVGVYCDSLSSQPASFSTDFPNAIQLDGLPY